VRAWGDTAEAASALSCCFLVGLQREGVLGCAKHFPGHGDTASDSHLELPLIPHDLERLQRLELLPFEAAIAAEAASVMTAHLLMPAFDAERPATLSKAVLTDLRRQQLGFNGLVVTDALVMEAIADRYGPGEAAALAFDAGADLILMPADAAAALDALEEGFSSGRWPMERLEQSLQRREQALVQSHTSHIEPTTAIQELALLQQHHRDLQQQLLGRQL
jgi:Beta-glucosidase-related glycosidases